MSANIGLILLIAAQVAHADTTETAVPAHFGAKVGVGVVTWGGADADDDFLSTDGKLGLSLAGFANLEIDELVSLDWKPWRLMLQSEMLYATKGAGIEIGTARGAYNLSYLEIAVLPRVEYAVSGKKFSPYALLGPAIGFLLSGEIKNSQGNVTDIKDDFTSTDFGLVLGLGADVPISAYATLVFELRADLGLTSIDGQGDGDDIKNRAYSLMVGYQY